MIYRFNSSEVDAGRVRIVRDGDEVPVEPQVFDLLLHLITQRGRVVTKEELLDTIWGDRFVSESALTTTIKSARRAVGDDGQRQHVIRTVHGKGYEFIADVQETEPPAGSERSEEPLSVAPDRAAPSHLAAPIQALIGRDELLEDLVAELMTSRLVTLVGPGGIGKTVLGYELARTVEQDYDDGVFAVEFVSVADSVEALNTLATALDVHRRHEGSLEDAIVDYLAPRRVLLLLDNCEHLVEPIGFVVDRILRCAPQVSAIITSREPLAVAGERVWPVEALAVAIDDESPLEALAAIPAIALFIERAQAADHRFAFDERTAPSVVEICRRLDGSPLAIELAAARTRAIDVTEISDRLDERFRLLKGVRRGGDPRHGTLQDAVAWSYNLLTPEEQQLFCQLCVFAGPFDLDAAEAVCRVGENDDILDLLTRLAEQSMVTIARPEQGGVAYDVLETLRTYGRSRLDDEVSVLLFGSHALYHAASSEKLERNLQTSVEPEASARANAGFADRRAALGFAVQVSDVDTAFRIIVSNREFAMRSMRYEALSWADTALECDGAPEHELHPVVKGVKAYGSWVRGEFEEALRLAREVEAEESDRNLARCGLAERVAGNVLFILGVADEALACMERQLELAVEADNPSRLTHARYMRAIALAGADQVHDATALAEQARTIGLSTGSPTDAALGWAAIGFVAAHSDRSAALSAFDESDSIARRAGNRWLSAFVRTESAGLMVESGTELQSACADLAELIDTWYRAGEWAQQWHTLARCIPALHAIRQTDRAVLAIGATEKHSQLGAIPVVPTLRSRALETAGELRASMGEERYASLHQQGADMPIADIVHQTRWALLE